MKNISVFDVCYGCGVCNAACSMRAITMVNDRNGFIHPVVDDTKCSECQLCLKVCAYNDKKLLKVSTYYNSYSAFAKDDNIRLSCSSGGIGYALSLYLMKIGYKICTVKYDADIQSSVHYIASTVDELSQSQGSKYIQSHTIPAFTCFKRGEKYLVIGTPCQIDSLRRYTRLMKMEEAFIFVDFFCHGVPSDLLWKKYLKEYGINNPVEVKWRDKRNGWHDSWNMVFKGPNEEKVSSMSQGDLFYKFFLRNRCLGGACYDDCKYKLTSSSADIRLGDLWGTKYQSDEKGVSGVITFTQRGDDILHQLDECTIIPESIDVVTESQMKRCPQRPSSFNYVEKALMTNEELRTIDKKARRIELFYDEIPRKIKHYIKRIKELLLCK